MTGERFMAALRRVGEIHAERAAAAERAEPGADEPENVDSVGSGLEDTDAPGRTDPGIRMDGTS